MQRLPSCERDLKKLKTIRSLEQDLLAAEKKIEPLTKLEIFQLTQSKNLKRMSECKIENKTFVIYKLRWATENPCRSDRDGIRIWYCVDIDSEEKIICLIEPADKKNRANYKP